MPRRPSLTRTITRAINQAQVAERRKQHKAQVNYAINNSAGPKEMPPTYRIVSFDFNPETRACKIEFMQSVQYRTIERYVTQNYVKHPIYSGWKTKTKSIKKSIKLTNENLEKLPNNSEPLISEFAPEIIERINNDEFYPSWYLNELIMFNCAEKSDALRVEKDKIMSNIQVQLKKLDDEIQKYKREVFTIKNDLNKNKNKESKSKRIIDKIEKSSKPIVLKILTFGIYGMLVSKKRYDKHLFLYNYYKKLNVDNVNDINNLETIINSYDSTKKKIESIKARVGSHYSGQIDVLQAEQSDMLELVVPLTD